MRFKKSHSQEVDDRLNQLIQLKRREKPDDAFWDKFDEELRSKQLAALVRTQSWYERLGKLSILIARKSAAVTATACIFALGVFTVSKSTYFTEEQSSSNQTHPVISQSEIQTPSIEPPIFVVDDFKLPAEEDKTELSYEINAAPSYEINALTKKTIPVSYQIIAEPKQFTAGQLNAGNDLGAKVIRTGNRF